MNNESKFAFLPQVLHCFGVGLSLILSCMSSGVQIFGNFSIISRNRTLIWETLLGDKLITFKCLWVLFACFLTIFLFVSPSFFLSQFTIPPSSTFCFSNTFSINLDFCTNLLFCPLTLTNARTLNKVKTWSATMVQLKDLITCRPLFMRFCGRKKLKSRLHLLLKKRTMKTFS